jgi:hypothetical protein
MHYPTLQELEPFDLPAQITSYFFFFFAYICATDLFSSSMKNECLVSSSEAIGLLDSFQNLVTIVSLLFLPVAVGLLGAWSLV